MMIKHAMSARLAALLAAMAAASAAVAQAPVIPETSRGETRADAINNSLANQERSRSQVQQNQFEINSLRNQPVIQPITPPGVVGPGPVINPR